MKRGLQLFDVAWLLFLVVSAVIVGAIRFFA